MRNERGFVLTVWAFSVAASVFFIAYTLSLSPLERIMTTNDFGVFYTAAQKLSRGELAQVYHRYDEVADVNDPALYPFVYPPIMLLAIAPMGQMERMQAASYWFGLQALMVALAIALIPKSILPSSGKCLLAGFILPFAVMTLLAGQAGLMTAALLIAACSNIRVRPWISGVCLGVLVVKPPMALILPVALLAGRQWRALAAAALTVLSLALLTALLWGAEPWRMFAALLPEHAKLLAQQQGYILQMMVSAYGFLRLLGAPHMLALAGQGLCALAAAFIVWRAAAHKDDKAYAGLLVAATLLASPYVFIYDLPALALVLAIIGYKGITGPIGSAERMLLAGAAFCPLIAVMLNGMHIPMVLIVLAGMCAALRQKKEA